MENVMTGVVIEKEELAAYDLVPAFVDKTEQWRKHLPYAMRLGNEFKGKTYLTVETTKGPRTIITTVWSVSENHLILKGGITIPLNSLIDIHY